MKSLVFTALGFGFLATNAHSAALSAEDALLSYIDDGVVSEVLVFDALVTEVDGIDSTGDIFLTLLFGSDSGDYSSSLSGDIDLVDDNGTLFFGSVTSVVEAGGSFELAFNLVDWPAGFESVAKGFVTFLDDFGDPLDILPALVDGTDYFVDLTFIPVPVPLPYTLPLLGSVLGGLFLRQAWRRRMKP